MIKYVAGILIFFGFMLLSQTTFAQHQGISFQAVIKKPDGSLPTVSGLTVKLQILDPIDKCILREEEHLGRNISAGYLNIVIGDSAAIVPSGRNPSPILSLSQTMDNKTTRTGLKCVDANDTVTDSNHTYVPSQVDRRLVRIRMTIDGQEIYADFNMRGVAFAGNSEMLNSKKDTDFVNINGAKNVTQANMESIFERFTKLDGILNNSNPAGDGLGVNISGNAATATTATSVSGTVAIANGGTGATSASAARTNLGLGPLATMTPTGTASATTYLRGDGSWQTVSGGGSVTSVAGKTGVVTLDAADVTDFNTAADARITAQKAANNGLATLNGSGKVPSTQLALAASDIPALDAAKITTGTFADSFLASLSIDKLLNGGGKYFNYKPSNAACADGEVLKYDSTLNAAAGGWKCAVDSGASGVVTSVGVALPSIFSVSGGPITTSGTITATLASQTQNQVFASPNGSDAAPTFRTLVAADLPTITVAKGGTNSTAALNNNRVMVSASGAIVEATAITADRALISNTNGIPVHSAVTNVELGYLSGVTSAVQTQLSAKTSATGWANYSVLRTNGSGAVEAINTATSGTVLQWSVTGPVFSSASFPTSTVANQLLYSSANNVVGGLTTANDAFLMTNGSGVPSWNVLSADNFVQYALLAGRSGGQTMKGGTAPSENLTLDSTAHATKGKVLINPTGGDVGIGTVNPAAKLEVAGGVKLGNDAATCDSTKEGTLKYVSPNLLLCNGTDWKLVQLVTPTANVELLSGTGSGMDVTGPGNPAYGSNVVFTYRNNGTANSATLGIALTSSTNFEITGDTCTGVVLSPTSTCTVTVRPMATAAGSLSSSIIVTW